MNALKNEIHCLDERVYGMGRGSIASLYYNPKGGFPPPVITQRIGFFIKDVLRWTLTR